jgi:acyl-CoA thioester hydrolase
MTKDDPLYRLVDRGEDDRAALAARFAELATLIRAVVPLARIEHVGATAVAGLPTKGDLDVQVRVHRERFDDARAALAARFRTDDHAYGPPDGASFDVDHPTVPAGVHLTVIDSDADEQWVFRDLLRGDPQLHASFVELRRAFDGRPMDEWRAAKGRFYERLKADPRFARTRALAAFPATLDLTVQWGEMDAYDHVNNVVYFRWFESSRMVLFRQLDFHSNTGVGPILASTGCRYKAPLYVGDVVTAAARIVDVADDRFVIEHALWSRDAARIAATGEAQIVAFDYATKKKARLPDDLRARIDALSR